MELQPYRNRLTLANRLGRLAWALVRGVLFRPTPTRGFLGWRRFLLRLFGARMGRGTVVHPSVRIWAPWNLEMDDDAVLAFDVDCYNVDKVRLGKHVTVSQYAFLCTASHDINDPSRALVTGPITIEAGAWVFADAFIGPGVTIGQGAVVAARAVVVKPVEPWTVVGGNPARFLKRREMRSAASPSSPPSEPQSDPRSEPHPAR